MADSFTTSLRIIQMPTGSNDTLWGIKADAAFAMLDQAIAGSAAIDLTSGDVVLTTANNATDQSRNAALSLSGTPGVTRTVTFPDVSKLTLVINSSNAPATLVTAGAGANYSLTPGQVAIVLCDGATNLYAFVIADLPGKGTLSQLYSGDAL